MHEPLAERRGLLVVQQGLQILIDQTECANFRQHLAQADTRLGDDGELTHAAARTIKEGLIFRGRAADELAVARNHFQLFDVIGLQPKAVGGAPDPTHRNSPADRSVEIVRQHGRQIAMRKDVLN